MPTYGRTKIYTDEIVVDNTNVVSVIKKAIDTHKKNRKEAEHLYDVYKGKQEILNRQKNIRPEIVNRCVVNHANEIVSFKVSYLLSNPIVYTNANTDGSLGEEIDALNRLMRIAGKAARDKEIADDFTIVGNAYRMILPQKPIFEGDPPFVIYTLNPMNTFVVYQNGIGESPMLGVTYTENATTNIVTYSAYTDKEYFKIAGNQIVETHPHACGCVPIFEYCNNNFRIGSFEIVESLLDSINALTSDRLDATEQAVQALTVFENCDIDTEMFDEMRARGAIKIKSVDGVTSKVYNVSTDLQQSDQQVQLDSLYDAVLKITGMPAQGNGNTSDSSNNGAMITKNGWYHAEARAKDTELLWEESETNMLRLVLQICAANNLLDLVPQDIKIKFTRRNYEDLLSKSQTFTTLMSTGYTDISDAYAAAGMFPDSEAAAIRGKKWHESVSGITSEGSQPSSNSVGFSTSVIPAASAPEVNPDDGGTE